MRFRFGKKVAMMLKTATTKALVIASVLVIVFLSPSAPSAQETCCELTSPDVCVPFLSDQDYILVPAEVAQQKCSLILDTGAPRLSYDDRLLGPVGPAIEDRRVLTALGTFSCKFYDAPDAKLGPFSLRTAEAVAATDFSRYRVDGSNIYGIIGMTFLRNYVLTIDFDNRLVVLSNKAPDATGCAFPINDVRGHPAVRGVLPGYGDVDFAIDTGFVGPIAGGLRREVFDALCDRGQMDIITRGRLCNEFSEASLDIGQLKSLNIGTFEHHGLLFCALDADAPNVLGLEYWSRFNNTFDFPRHTVWMKRSARYSEAGDVIPRGLYLVRLKSKVVADIIYPGTAAEQSGLERGDVLLAINNCDISNWRLFDVRQRLMQTDRPIALQYERAGQIIETVLPPERDVETSRGGGVALPPVAPPRNSVKAIFNPHSAATSKPERSNRKGNPITNGENAKAK